MEDEEVNNPGVNSVETLSKMKKKKGGFRAASFIYGFANLDNMSFVANIVSLMMYFLFQMHFDLHNAANTVTNFMGASFLLSLVGAFISDTYLNRFTTCLLFGIIELTGLAMMTIQAHYPSLLPQACGKSSCVSGSIAIMFYVSLVLLAVGTGGVRGALTALGGDQFDQKDPKEAKAMARYFNYLMFSATLGSAFGVTFIVWVLTNKSRWKGFLICTALTSGGFISLICGKPFYRLKVPGDSPLVRVAQVIVVSFKNRRMPLPENAEELFEINEKGAVLQEEKISHTNQFRCLDKAAILPIDYEPAPWTVCTVTQVEEVKVITRMLPIIASTIIMNTCLAQLQTFSTQQGNLMNCYLGSFKVPAASIPVIPLIFMTVLLPIYDFFFVPFARKITGHPSGITQLQRVGVGLVLSVISMAVAAIVEKMRKDHFVRDPTHLVSLFWLSFQYGIFGIADMFTLVGLLEFFYREAPAGMKSLSTSFTYISMSFGYFLSTVFVDIIDSVTKKVTPSKQGWLHGQDFNQNHLDLFYWFLAIVSFLNFGNYLYWASWYKYKMDEGKIEDEPMLSSNMLFVKEEEKNGVGLDVKDEKE